MLCYIFKRSYKKEQMKIKTEVLRNTSGIP